MGKCSETGTPGREEAIGWNSPRISAGASGFMSQVSWWLGPPLRKIVITASADARGPPSRDADRTPSAAISEGRFNPAIPADPTRRKPRRTSGWDIQSDIRHSFRGSGCGGDRGSGIRWATVTRSRHRSIVSDLCAEGSQKGTADSLARTGMRPGGSGEANVGERETRREFAGNRHRQGARIPSPTRFEVARFLAKSRRERGKSIELGSHTESQ